MLVLSFNFSYSQNDLKKNTPKQTVNGITYYIHTVEPGQTLYGLSKIYEVTSEDIIRNNPDASTGLKPGMVLKIPVASTGSTANQQQPKTQNSKPNIVETTAIRPDSAGYLFHKVEAGQTLYSLSKLYNTDIESIKKQNNISDIKNGQIIKILRKPSNNLPQNKLQSAPFQPAITVQQANVVIDNTPILKEEYNVALMLPFNVSANESIEIEDIARNGGIISAKTDMALSFNAGVLAAIDSLKKQNMKVKLYVYDIDDKDSLSITQLLKKPELKSMNLIIGPLYTSNFIPVSKYAKENNIPIVSPLSQLNKILFNNPLASKATPAVVTQVEKMAEYVSQRYGKRNIVLVNNGNSKEGHLVNIFKSTANAGLIKYMNRKDTIREVLYLSKGISGLEAALSKTDTNIIIVPANNQSFVTDFMTALYRMNDISTPREQKTKFNIVVFGLQSWNGFDNLDIQYLNKMNVHTPSNSFIDYESQRIKNIIQSYRAEYKGEPDSYFFQGFDIAYYYLVSLKQYGVNFQSQLSQHPFNGVQSSFKFKESAPGSGYENQSVYIIKYQDYKLHRVQ